MEFLNEWYDLFFRTITKHRHWEFKAHFLIGVLFIFFRFHYSLTIKRYILLNMTYFVWIVIIMLNFFSYIAYHVWTWWGGVRPDHLIKSQITTANHNNAQLIKDVISVRCVINNKLQYCTYLWSSTTNLQHYRPPTPLRGTPLLRYLERGNPPKPKNPAYINILNNLEKK